MANRNDTAVVKIGTSSITDDEGVIDRAMVAKLCDEVPIFTTAVSFRPAISPLRK